MNLAAILQRILSGMMNYMRGFLFRHVRILKVILSILVTLYYLWNTKSKKYGNFSPNIKRAIIDSQEAAE
jgi:hypothetical protein